MQYIAILCIFLAIAILPAYADVTFIADVPKYATIQRDFSFKLTAYNDMTEQHMGKKFLKGADVSIHITPSWHDFTLAEWKGNTWSRGYFSGNELITNHEFGDHALYNMTITVSYGDSSETQIHQFWTNERHSR